jgi:hypothetical protein
MPDCNRKGAWSCGGGGSSPSSELVLCVEASDSVLSCGRCCGSIHLGGIHSGKPSAFIEHVQTLLKEMGVVVAA